ncbi:hypothetical protein [Flexibacterium corallicola]|uniref:hypothetical protein n=1 Tax=Flexibacterium corallicola TaxID=3037259 RepID=UPI00286F9098|nr:hypothetical protein [Pseudovibrio sp. M1P-2-3]
MAPIRGNVPALQKKTRARRQAKAEETFYELLRRLGPVCLATPVPRGLDFQSAREAVWCCFAVRAQNLTKSAGCDYYHFNVERNSIFDTLLF